MKKGQTIVSLVITGALAIGASTGFILTFLNPRIDRVDADNTVAHTQFEHRLTALEGKIDRIPYMESKLDSLLNKNNISPRIIEDIINSKLNNTLLISTTTSIQENVQKIAVPM